MNKKHIIKNLVERFANELARLEIEYENVWAQVPIEETIIQDEDLRFEAEHICAKRDALRDMFEMLAEDFGISVDLDEIIGQKIDQYKRYIA